MLKKIPLVVLIMAFVILSAACTNTTPAAPPEDAAAKPPAPVVATEEKPIYLVGEQDFIPISFEKDGQITGINVDIIREAFKRMNVPLKLELMPWKRCLELAKDGTADGFFSPFKTAEREELYLYIKEPLMVEKNVLAVAKNSPITFDGDMKKMGNYTFGILIGYATLDQYTKDGTITKVEESQTVAEALKKLATGRGMDIYVNNDLIVKYNAKNEGLLDQIKILETPMTETPNYLAFTKRRDLTDLASRFEAELEAMKADGTYQAIMEVYTGQ